MSKPREDWEAPIHGASVELISAMSALNMEPSPIKSPEKDAIYLSEIDEMARHSYEHMQAAITCLQKAQQQLENLAMAAEQVLHVCHGIDWDMADGQINPSIEWLIEKLTKLYKNKRREQTQDTQIPMTVEEAFVLLQKSHFDDCANGVCGLLRSLAERIDPEQEDEVQGNLKQFLLSCAQGLRDNNERSTREITEHFGEDRRKELARQFVEDGVSPYQIWLNRKKDF